MHMKETVIPYCGYRRIRFCSNHIFHLMTISAVMMLLICDKRKVNKNQNHQCYDKMKSTERTGNEQEWSEKDVRKCRHNWEVEWILHAEKIYTEMRFNVRVFTTNERTNQPTSEGTNERNKGKKPVWVTWNSICVCITAIELSKWSATAIKWQTT